MREQIADSARRLGLEVDVRRLVDPAANVAEAAAAVGCAEGCIARSTVFIADGDAVLCITCSSETIDPDLLADALDVAELRPATASEVRAATGFSAAGVPPFGHELPIVLDARLLDHETVWAPGGDERSICRVEPQRLAGCAAATVAAVTS